MISPKPWDPAPNQIFSFCKATPVPSDLISICLTNYNYADFIKECLESLAAQTHEALDLIIIDDASDEADTHEIILSWLTEHKKRFYKITFLANAFNQGPSFSRNLAFQHAAGESVFIIDADNTLYPTALEKLYAALNNGQFPAVYSQLEEFGERRGIGRADIFNPELLKKNNYVDVMALIRKNIWAELGGFTDIDRGWEDYDFWLKFIDHNLEPGYLPEILCRYRVHNKSRTVRDALSAHDNLELIMELRHPTPPDQKLYMPPKRHSGPTLRIIEAD
ncbi:glycosyltransferase [Acetobacter sp. DsW_059]|uniref:glycosyltransferase family 2 protein n=1 Tax=Acetobacter sp. DsW_059 TaxID=1670661 RepID=UPI000A3A7032|nr:glycosyltransferase [Acetobacter sp. DsW_059]